MKKIAKNEKIPENLVKHLRKTAKNPRKNPRNCEKFKETRAKPEKLAEYLRKLYTFWQTSEKTWKICGKARQFKEKLKKNREKPEK